MTGVVVEPFGGAGGASEGMRRAGIHAIGIEKDRWACATRAAAGHLTIRADVEHLPLEPFRRRGVTGLWASPPCPDFSRAGKRAGRTGETGRLVDLVPMWVEALRPEWVACEQVPDVLPIWLEHAYVYRQLGYSTWCGLLDPVNYGVPQNRPRAVLIASQTKVAAPPAATHAKRPDPSLFGDAPLLPWVSMADALGWSGELDRRTNSKDGRGGMVPTVTVPTNRPSATVTGKAGQGQWRRLLNPGRTPTQPHRRLYDAAREPAPTIALGHDMASWCWERPATTVCGDTRIGRPGHKDRAGGEAQFAEDAVKVTIPELLILQGMPPDYPLVGNKTQRAQQVGNLVPPPLAEAIVRELTGQAKEQAA